MGLQGPAGPPDHLGSPLVLSNASMNQRCILVQNQLFNEMVDRGRKVVQTSYRHTGYLFEILNSLPVFDGAVLQSHYQDIPVRLLNLLQEKTGALVLDGHSLSGVDVDRAGTDWEGALDTAVGSLRALGHREIGLVSLKTMEPPILNVRRAFVRAGQLLGKDITLHPPILLESVQHPTQNVEAALSALGVSAGRLPFSAVILVGISDSGGAAAALQRLDVSVPDNLSVYILGHYGVSSEHLDHFTITGSSYQEAAVQIMATLRKRLSTHDMPPQVVYLQCREVVGNSTMAPVEAAIKAGRISAASYS